MKLTRRQMTALMSTGASVALMGQRDRAGPDLAQPVGTCGRAAGAEHCHGPGPVAQDLPGSADAGGARQGRQAATGRRACPGGADGSEAARRGRQVWRHLAARLHRSRRRRERQPHQRLRQAALLGLYRQQDRAVGRQGLEDERRRQELHALAEEGHALVGRRALHRRRLRLLVRGPLLEQGDRADADRRHGPAGQARPGGQGRRDHRPLRVRRPLFSLRGDDGRRHADRRRPVGAAVPEIHLRRLFARALPQAVPAQIFHARRGQRESQGCGLRELGAVPALQEGLVAQSRIADAGAVADGPADQHADLGAGAQPLLLRSRHGRKPAALYRPRPADPGRGSRGAEPQGDLRRV